MQRLEAAVKAYSGLAMLPAPVRKESLLKLTGMLLHPFPRVSGEQRSFCRPRPATCQSFLLNGCEVRLYPEGALCLRTKPMSP
jgi:hypothetical protein